MAEYEKAVQCLIRYIVERIQAEIKSCNDAIQADEYHISWCALFQADEKYRRVYVKVSGDNAQVIMSETDVWADSSDIALYEVLRMLEHDQTRQRVIAELDAHAASFDLLLSERMIRSDETCQIIEYEISCEFPCGKFDDDC